MMIRVLLILMVWTPVAPSAQETKNGPEGDCGFSKLRPRHMSHFVDRGAINKVTPQYPPAANAKGISGTVMVRVLVNRQGQVERTCPVYVVGERRPDRSLVVAAEAAVLQWSYPPNFGLKPADGIQFDYVQDVLIFKFVPLEQEKVQIKHR